MPKRQPPPGWVEFRRQAARNTSTYNDPIDKIIIKGIRSITTNQFGGNVV